MPEGEENRGAEEAAHLVEAAADEAERESRSGSGGSKIRSWAVLVAAAGALLTSLAAILKPQDHTVSQTSYEEVSKAFQRLSDQSQLNHDDIRCWRCFWRRVIERAASAA